jgi:hypothetical protein
MVPGCSLGRSKSAAPFIRKRGRILLNNIRRNFSSFKILNHHQPTIQLRYINVTIELFQTEVNSLQRNNASVDNFWSYCNLFKK